jgi:HlyD family secretion protein
MRKKWVIVTVLILVVGGGLVFAKASASKKPKEQESPFRLGKAQAEDLQVSVREVGVVDPETKVDVKSPVSGRLVGLAVREGELVARGQVLAEVEPDVNQAQSLSDVKAAVSQADLRLRDAQRILKQQQALYEAGLIANDKLRDVQMARDLAADALSNARARYSIVEHHGIPISGGSLTQRAHVASPMAGVVVTRGVELGQSVTSGVSSFNDGTVLFTVADLGSLLIKVNLNEVDIAKVRVGQPVRVTLDA